MCESDVYLVDENGERTLLMASVDKLAPDGDNIWMRDTNNRELTVRAKIAELSLVEHIVLLKKAPAAVRSPAEPDS
jgi:predicted RNA-binding protein